MEKVYLSPRCPISGKERLFESMRKFYAVEAVYGREGNSIPSLSHQAYLGLTRKWLFRIKNRPGEDIMKAIRRTLMNNGGTTPINNDWMKIEIPSFSQHYTSNYFSYYYPEAKDGKNMTDKSNAASGNGNGPVPPPVIKNKKTIEQIKLAGEEQKKTLNILTPFVQNYELVNPERTVGDVGEEIKTLVKIRKNSLTDFTDTKIHLTTYLGDYNANEDELKALIKKAEGTVLEGIKNGEWQEQLAVQEALAKVKLKNLPYLTVDFGVTIEKNGIKYNTDATQTFILTKNTELRKFIEEKIKFLTEAKKLAEYVVKEAFNKGIFITWGEVEDKVWELYENKGLEKYSHFNNSGKDYGLGHFTGLKGHESDILGNTTLRRDTVLKSGMVFTIEPQIIGNFHDFIYLHLRVKDTYGIENGQLVNLTSSSSADMPASRNNEQQRSEQQQGIPVAGSNGYSGNSGSNGLGGASSSLLPPGALIKVSSSMSAAQGIFNTVEYLDTTGSALRTNSPGVSSAVVIGAITDRLNEISARIVSWIVLVKDLLVGAIVHTSSSAQDAGKNTVNSPVMPEENSASGSPFGLGERNRVDNKVLNSLYSQLSSFILPKWQPVP